MIKVNKIHTSKNLLFMAFLATFCLPLQAENMADAAKSVSFVKPAIRFNKPYGYYVKIILSKISPSSDQERKINMIVESYRSVIEPLRETYQQRNAEFLQAMVNGKSSEDVMTKQVELGRLYCEIHSLYCLMDLEIRKQMNPDQIVKYEQYRKEQGWN